MSEGKPKHSARKVGRRRRLAGRGPRQWARSAANKLRRINRDRAKAGLPPIRALPLACRDWQAAQAPGRAKPS